MRWWYDMNIVTFGYETGTMLETMKDESIYLNIDYSLNSIFSSVSKPIDVDRSQIAPKQFNKQVILANELNKNFLKEIEEISLKNDYLIIDLLDERFDLMQKDGRFVLDSWLFKDSEFSIKSHLYSFKRDLITIEDWKKSCDLFI